MTELDVSHSSLVLFQAVSELRCHRLEVKYRAGITAALPFMNDAEKSFAASYEAEKAALENFAWPTAKKWLRTPAVAKLNSWLQLYMTLTSLQETAAQAAVMEAMQEIIDLEEHLLELAAQLCKATYQDSTLSQQREDARQQIEDSYAKLGQVFDAVKWTHAHHRRHCADCLRRLAADTKQNRGLRGWLRMR